MQILTLDHVIESKWRTATSNLNSHRWWTDRYIAGFPSLTPHSPYCAQPRHCIDSQQYCLRLKLYVGKHDTHATTIVYVASS